MKSLEEQIASLGNILNGRQCFVSQIVRGDSTIYAVDKRMQAHIPSPPQRYPLDERWQARRQLHAIYDDSNLDSEVRALAAQYLNYSQARLWTHENIVLPLRSHFLGY